eukprot:4549453-Prorocentrum_lima.AAC.1
MRRWAPKGKERGEKNGTDRIHDTPVLFSPNTLSDCAPSERCVSLRLSSARMRRWSAKSSATSA